MFSVLLALFQLKGCHKLDTSCVKFMTEVTSIPQSTSWRTTKGPHLSTEIRPAKLRTFKPKIKHTWDSPKGRLIALNKCCIGLRAGMLKSLNFVIALWAGVLKIFYWLLGGRAQDFLLATGWACCRVLIFLLATGRARWRVFLVITGRACWRVFILNFFIGYWAGVLKSIFISDYWAGMLKIFYLPLGGRAAEI